MGEGSDCANNDILEKLFNGVDFLKNIVLKMPVNFVFGGRNKLLGKGNIPTPKLIVFICSSSNNELDDECFYIQMI